MTNYKEKIPAKFWSGENQPKCNTVGALIKQLSLLPKELRIECGFNDGVRVTVYNINQDSIHVELEEIDY